MSIRFDSLLLSRPFLGGLFPCACTLLTLDDTIYIIRTGKYGSVVQFGGFLQGTVNNERLGNEAIITPRRPQDLARLTDKRPSVRFKRADIQEITTHRVNPNPVTWLQLLFDATMQIKTSKGTFLLTFHGKPLSLVEEAAKTLWHKTESSAAS